MDRPIKIAAEHSLRDRILIEKTGSPCGSGEIAPVVPAPSLPHHAPRWMTLELSGINTTSKWKTRAARSASDRAGRLTVKSCSGFTSLSSIQGEIRVQGARGRVEASSVNQTVHLGERRGPDLRGIGERWNPHRRRPNSIRWSVHGQRPVSTRARFPTRVSTASDSQRLHRLAMPRLPTPHCPSRPSAAE